MPASLDEQELLDLAHARFGLDLEGEQDAIFWPALAALCKALNQEARLSPDARERTEAHLLDLLRQRAALTAHEREVPTLADTPVEQPIIITGFPRTGTTLLHNLLARVEGLWAPPLWQLRDPLRVGESTGGEDPKAATVALLDRLYAAAPAYRSIHPMDPDWPDQCNWLLRKSFSTMANAFTWFVPGYVQHLVTADMRPAYADHRRWLRLLLERRSRAEGDRPRLALKDPFHMWHTEALLDVYPDATIIHLHREPAEIVPSFASLCETLQSVDTDSPRRSAEIGHFCLFILSKGLASVERARQKAGDRYLDLSYRELVASPGAVLRKLGSQLGFDGSASAVERAGTWLEDNRRHKAGRHEYALDDFGLTPEVVEEDFAAYRARFEWML